MKKIDRVGSIKKGALFLALFGALLAAAPSAFAETGVGLQSSAWFSYSPYFGPSIALSFTRRIHIMLEYGVDLVTPYNRRFGISGDYWLLRPKVGDFGVDSGRIYLFCGPGIFINYAAGKDWDGILSGGIRLPFGVDYEIKRLDFFLQAAPSITMISAQPGDWFIFYASFGFRCWL